MFQIDLVFHASKWLSSKEIYVVARFCCVVCQVPEGPAMKTASRLGERVYSAAAKVCKIVYRYFAERFYAPYIFLER